MVEDCFLLLGTNLGNKKNNLEIAAGYIEKKVGPIVKVSCLYASEPWGYTDSEPYINQAVVLKTHLEPLELLKKCLDIEKVMGRVRSGIGYEARIIDIDIIFYGPHIIHQENLTVPHPKMHERNFVLFPLDELSSDFMHPILMKTVGDLKKDCVDTGWVKKITP